MEIPALGIGCHLYSLTMHTLGVTVTVTTVTLAGILEAMFNKLSEIHVQGIGRPLYSLTVHTLAVTVPVTTVTLF